jgi:hypothetical protein
MQFETSATHHYTWFDQSTRLCSPAAALQEAMDKFKTQLADEEIVLDDDKAAKKKDKKKKKRAAEEEEEEAAGELQTFVIGCRAVGLWQMHIVTALEATAAQQCLLMCCQLLLLLHTWHVFA